ncbi:hypothetical protein [Clostridium sp. E02]|uniref:hypothetical protein n=1 Tax=Clostridium sp. E02 TaxID=2487134 RepID=UPI000F53358A|nr:hypothetical protein [Clostridium sp. E02]
MKKLRIYKANKGNMLKLVRMQKQDLLVAVGCEEERIYLSGEMFRSEKKKLSEEQRYVDRITHSMPFPEVKKIVYFKNYIWGL